MKSRAYTDAQITLLKELMNSKFEAMEKAVDKLATTNNAAIGKVETTTAARFDSVNEFRAQLKDQSMQFVTRRELWGAVITIVTLVLGAAGILMTMK